VAIGFGGVVFSFIGRGEVRDIILYLITCLVNVGEDILLVGLHGRVRELSHQNSLIFFSSKIRFYILAIK
jgi:hypothetical protein